jgi:hypothetical protein
MLNAYQLYTFDDASKDIYKQLDDVKISRVTAVTRNDLEILLAEFESQLLTVVQ